MTIGRDSFMCFLILFFGLLKLNLVDLDAVLGVCEVEIHGKRIRMVNILAFWRLGQYSVLGTCKGLQSSFKLLVP